MKPRADQLRFLSSANGEVIIDAYLEACEKGGRSLGDLLSDLFDNSGLFRSDIFEFREDPDNPGMLQFRVGDFFSPGGGWVTLTYTDFSTFIAACEAQRVLAQAAATAAANSATNAASSAAASAAAKNIANGYANNAGLSSSAASNSASNAAASATAAANSEIAAASAASSATTSASSASSSATAAGSSATNAAASATSASSSASTATTQATSATSSATSANTSKNAAATSATNAATSATNAATSATNAANSATSASGSAATATTKAGEASTSATNAAASATAAAASAADAASVVAGALQKSGGTMTGALKFATGIDIEMRGSTADSGSIAWKRASDDSYGAYFFHAPLYNGLFLQTVSPSTGAVINSLVISDNVANQMKLNGNDIWHSANLDPATYLAKSGGTMTGDLLFAASKDITLRGTTADPSVLNWFRDTGSTLGAQLYHNQSTSSFTIRTFNASGSLINTVLLSDSVSGSFSINGSQIWHTGNFDPADYVTTSATRVKATAVAGGSPGFEMYDVNGVRRAILLWNYSNGALQLQNYAADGTTILNTTVIGGSAGVDLAHNGVTVATAGNIGSIYGGNIPQGSVGAIQMLAHGTLNTALSYGTSYAGSALKIATLFGDLTTMGVGLATAPAGTWKCLGSIGAQAGKYSISLFLRIA